MTRTFDNLILVGRPASGKSEFIDFMEKTPVDERSQVFHIGKFEEVDDYRWLVEKWKEDDMWEEAGYERLFSSRDNVNYDVKPDKYCLYDMMFAKFNYEIAKNYLSRPEFYNDGTLLVEFSRGRKDAYKNALSRLSKEILSKAAILYIKVDFEESWRRNVKRYEEKLKYSKLAHLVPRETMERMYSIDDWAELTDNREAGNLNINGVSIPFATMNNDPELTERKALSERYGKSLDKLSDLYFRRA